LGSISGEEPGVDASVDRVEFRRDSWIEDGPRVRPEARRGGFYEYEAYPDVVTAEGEEPLFSAGDRATISTQFPIGRYLVLRYICGKGAVVEWVNEPPGVNNEGPLLPRRDSAHPVAAF
jgi:hypothetical protein